MSPSNVNCSSQSQNSYLQSISPVSDILDNQGFSPEDEFKLKEETESILNLKVSDPKCSQTLKDIPVIDDQSNKNLNFLNSTRIIQRRNSWEPSFRDQYLAEINLKKMLIQENNCLLNDYNIGRKFPFKSFKNIMARRFYYNMISIDGQNQVIVSLLGDKIYQLHVETNQDLIRLQDKEQIFTPVNDGPEPSINGIV